MEELIRVQDEIVIDRTETKVTKENDDELTKEVIMLRNGWMKWFHSGTTLITRIEMLLKCSMNREWR